MRRKLLVWGIFLTCMSLVSVFSLSETTVYAETQAESQARLEKELREVEAQIAQQQVLVDGKQKERQSLERDISILDAKILKAKLGLKARTIEIQSLGSQIGDKQIVINELNGKMERQKQSLAQLIRKTHEIDNFSLVEVVLANDNFSTFFEDVDAFQAIKTSLRDSFNLIGVLKDDTEGQKVQLEDRHSEENRLKALQELEKRQIEEREAEKEKILKTTKGQEASYQTLLKAQQKTAAQIRQALFALRGTEGIPFGTAVEYAKSASKLTGVRAALILAILSQESDLGKNVGQCLITDIKTGDGKGKNTGTPFPGTMKVPRDTVPFERIVKALGLDWTTTAVSCPQPGGYGGAMGPTQFIPSTWEMYEPRIRAALGISATNPWDALNAITATGLYLQDMGAAGGGYQSEHTAAARYYAGGAWATSGQHYGDQVLQKAIGFQNNITFLDEN